MHSNFKMVTVDNQGMYHPLVVVDNVASGRFVCWRLLTN